MTQALKYRYQIILSEETYLAVIIDSVAVILNYLTILTTWLIFTCQLKTLRSLFKSFEEIEKIHQDSCILAKPKNNHLSNFAKHLFLINFLYISVITSAVIVVSLCQDMGNQGQFWLLYNIFLDVFINIAFLFFKVLNLIRIYYKLLNGEISALLSSRKINIITVDDITPTPLTKKVFSFIAVVPLSYIEYNMIANLTKRSRSLI